MDRALALELKSLLGRDMVVHQAMAPMQNWVLSERRILRFFLIEVPKAIYSAATTVKQGMAAVRGLLSRSRQQLYWVVPRAAALRASVGSTEASDGRLARVADRLQQRRASLRASVSSDRSRQRGSRFVS
jgi:hypothetical protein